MERDGWIEADQLFRARGAPGLPITARAGHLHHEANAFAAFVQAPAAAAPNMKSCGASVEDEVKKSSPSVEMTTRGWSSRACR